jgi:hypothetical protein
MILLLVVIISPIFTAATLLAALADHRHVVAASRDGRDFYIVRSDIRSEALRFIKCVILVWAYAYGWYATTHYDLTETGRRVIGNMMNLDGSVILLLALNSLADLWSRHHSPHAPRVLQSNDK